MDENINQLLANKSYLIQLETSNDDLCESLKETLTQHIEEEIIKKFAKDMMNYNFLLGFRSACLYFKNNLIEDMSYDEIEELVTEITNKAAILNSDTERN